MLVVNNAPSSPATERLLHERFAWAEHIVVSEPGLNLARNAALEAADTDLVAFVDDDVEVDRDWARHVRGTFAESPDATTMTGLVEPVALDTPGARIFEAYGGFARGYRRRWIFSTGAPDEAIAFPLANTGAMGTGANLAVRRAQAIAMGGFDLALDSRDIWGGGDLEFLFRTIKSGGMLVYEPAAMVRHRHRRGVDAVLDQIESWGTGLRVHLERTARAYPEERWPVDLLRWWLYLTWMPRRALVSMVKANFPLALIYREIRGSLRGGRRFHDACTRYPPPAAPRGGPSRAHRGVVTELEVDVAGSARAIAVPDAGLARVRIRVGARVLGTVSAPPVGGIIGMARLRDAVGDTLRTALLGMPDEAVASRVIERLSTA